MTHAALKADSFTVRFGSFEAVRDVCLELPVGARHAIIGPNGAGKTSLVQALTGSIAQAAGTIALNGEDVTRCSQKERVRHGLARTYQINQLFRGLTVLENVALAIFEREGKTCAFWRSAAADKQVLAEARHHLAFVNLVADAERPVRSLPYGSQRLLEIAIALATKPRVLILDEPAAGVPTTQSEAIFERIHALPSSLTLLFVEHDMNLVFRFAERITVLVGGRILTEGTPAEISADPHVREVYLGRKGYRHAAA
jgi:branched-chain amino acid transport system ATP-binding protein